MAKRRTIRNAVASELAAHEDVVSVDQVVESQRQADSEPDEPEDLTAAVRSLTETVAGLAKQVNMQGNLIMEIGRKRMSEEDIDRKTAEMVRRFRNQGGTYEYLVWDRRRVEEKDAERVYRSDIKPSVVKSNPQLILEEYNRRCHRTWDQSNGDDPLRFKLKEQAEDNGRTN